MTESIKEHTIHLEEIAEAREKLQLELVNTFFIMLKIDKIVIYAYTTCFNKGVTIQKGGRGYATRLGKQLLVYDI